MTQQKFMAPLFALALAAGFSTAQAAEFTAQDLQRWEAEYMTVVKKGRELWTSPKLGTNGVACAAKPRS